MHSDSAATLGNTPTQFNNEVVRNGLEIVYTLLQPEFRSKLRPRHRAGSSPHICPNSTAQFESERVDERHVTPGRIFGRCVSNKCAHYESFCTLGTAVSISGRYARSNGVKARDACGIAVDCRWYSENGINACQMCPHIEPHPLALSMEIEND